jgi:hypothetical protein
MREAALRAHRAAGLTGQVELLEPYPSLQLPRRATVKVTGGVVSLKENGKALGTSAKCPDGEFRLLGKFILVADCHPSMKPGWSLTPEAEARRAERAAQTPKAQESVSDYLREEQPSEEEIYSLLQSCALAE